MRVAQIGFFNDPLERAPEELLSAWPTLVDVAEAAACAGVQVTVVQACRHAATLERAGVRYEFLPFGARVPRRRGLIGLAARLRAIAAEVLHVHGLEFSNEVRSLAQLAPGVPLLLQDHASHPPPLWRRATFRRGLTPAAAVSFCASEQALPFRIAGLLGVHTAVLELPESTSRFVPGDRAEARSLTGVQGDPAVLWVGHLDANKDPLTVLEGIGKASLALPNLTLYCCYGSAPLGTQVGERIGADPALAGRVYLLGRVAHPMIEQLMRAADVFVLGSHREGSGYSLIEALACGLPPAVSDIPSFRSLTAGGRIGTLWPCGDARALAQALQALAPRLSPALRSQVRLHFERELSLSALGAKLAGAYEALLRGPTPRPGRAGTLAGAA